MKRRMNMEIIIGEGLPNLKFGFKENEIIRLFGQPDKIVNQDSDNRDLYFNDEMIVCKIEVVPDSILGWIEVHNTEATMFNKSIFQMAQKDLLKFLTERLNEEPEFTNYESFETYYYDKSEVELQIEFGKLKNINFGYLYDINDKPIIKTNT